MFNTSITYTWVDKRQKAKAKVRFVLILEIRKSHKHVALSPVFRGMKLLVVSELHAPGESTLTRRTVSWV